MVSNTERLVAAISGELEQQERSVSWLSRETGITYRVLLTRLSGKSDFSITEVLTIAEALQMDPRDLFDQAIAPLKEAA